jgi:hypothetical protein
MMTLSPPDAAQQNEADEADVSATNYVAKNKIVHGNGVDADGEVNQLVFEPGDPIIGLDDDTVEQLLASDSIGEPDEATGKALDENAALKKQVADLTAQLQAALSTKTPQQQQGGMTQGAGGNLPLATS